MLLAEIMRLLEVNIIVLKDLTLLRREKLWK